MKEYQFNIEKHNVLKWLKNQIYMIKYKFLMKNYKFDMEKYNILK